MRICLVSSHYPPAIGGTARYTWDLAHALAARGHGVTVVVVEDCPTEPIDSDAGGAGLPSVVRLPMDTGGLRRVIAWLPAGRHLVRSRIVQRALARLHRAERFDVVEFASWGALGSAHTLRPLAPQVLRVTTGIRQLPVESVGACERLREAMGRAVLAAAERLVIRGSDRVIAPTHSHLTQIRPRRPAVEHVMPFGVRVESDAVAPGGPIALCVGRLTPRKGFDLFVLAAGEYLACDARSTIVIVGHDHFEPGSGSVWERLGRPLADRYPGRVTWLPEVDETGLEALYRDAAVCAVPSRYESFGLVFLEAMAHGRPVVTWDTAFAREVVGELASITEFGDSAAFGRALHESAMNSMSDPELAGRLQRRMQMDYPMERFVAETERIYRELAGGSSRP